MQRGLYQWLKKEILSSYCIKSREYKIANTGFHLLIQYFRRKKPEILKLQGVILMILHRYIPRVEL